MCNNKAVDCVQHRSLSSSWASSMLEFHSSLFLKHAYMGIPHPRCESGPLNLRCPFGKRRWMCLATQVWVTPPSSAKGPRTRFCCAGDLDLLLEDKRELEVSLLTNVKSPGSWPRCSRCLCSRLSSAMHEDLSVPEKNLFETQYFCWYYQESSVSLSQPYYLH